MRIKINIQVKIKNEGGCEYQDKHEHENWHENNHDAEN